jgi:hypothetical protein
MGGKLNTINEVLVSIEKLDVDDQTYVSEVLSKRLIELRRSEIARRAKEAERAYKQRKTKKGSFKDLWKDLNA